MPWARFSGDFDWSPLKRRGRVVIAYRAGMTVLVAQACLEAAVAAGKAEPAERPNADADERRQASRTRGL